MKIFILFFTLLGTGAEKPANLETTKSEIHALCMKKLQRPLDKKRAICDCSLRNLATKNDAAELAKIYKHLSGKSGVKPASASTASKDDEALYEFATDVSEQCLNNPYFNAPSAP